PLAMDVQPRASEYGARRHHACHEVGDGRLAPLLATAKSGGITTGLEGRELGQLMREVHDAYPGGRAAFVAWIDQLEDHKLAPLHAYIREVAADLITSAKKRSK
ncbi:hypothetical protein P2B79_23040, partial [Xanthomonas perforans]